VRVLADRYSAWTRKKTTLFSGHYLRNRSTLDLGVLGYIDIVLHKEHPPEVWHIPPGTPCIYIYTYIHTHTHTHIYIYIYIPWILCLLDHAS